MLNGTTPEIKHRKWGPKPLLNLCWIILYFVEFCGLFFFWYLFLVIISSFEAIFCSISRHYSSKKVVILHFRKASKCVMLMSSFHVLHDWTPCGNTANVQKIMNRFSMDPYFYYYKQEFTFISKKPILVSSFLANLLLIFQLQQRAQLCIWDCRAVLWLFEIFLEKIVNSFKKEVDFYCTIVWSYNSAIEGNYLGGL